MTPDDTRILRVNIGFSRYVLKSLYEDKTNDSEHNDGKPPPFAVLDSGAELNVSGRKEDFHHISTQPTVCLNGIDGQINGGKPVAYMGMFKRNNLGIGKGVWYPNLGHERIISTNYLIKDGWEIFLRKDMSKMKRRRRLR